MKEKIGVVGVGQMGSDMAALALAYEYPVVLTARTMAKAEAGRQRIERDLDDMIRYGKIGEAEKEEMLNRLCLSGDYEALADCAFVIEAVAEKREVKQEVYEKIEAVCPADTILLSETSGIPADELAEKMKHKERFLIAHSWNPPHVIPLVEVVRGSQTSEETVQKATAFLESMDREVVVLRKAVPGFIGNRIQHAMFREALALIEAGVATPEEIDKVVYYSFGQRFSSVGLMEYYDSCGLDLQYQVQSYLLADLSDAKGPQKPLTDCLAAGKMGAKTGQGLYDWTQKDRADFSDRKSRPFLKFVNWKRKS
jgi:3-hydroxybutyryl-CoA dehydrogenase